MSRPTIAATKPTVMELEAGTYTWCACGKSKNQPFCDGSHTGTGFEPMEFTFEAPNRVALCNCKHSVNGPFCDGGHKGLPQG